MKSLLVFLMTATLAQSALASFNSGSTGTDGPFNPTSNVTVDLSLAGSGPGTGAYDPGRWAVIFNYTTITIPLGVTVRFANHPSGAPVVWLASGDVNISGTVILDGAPGAASFSFSEPGPGGFAGGRGGLDYNLAPASPGFGPGGGQRDNEHGSYGTGSRTYGNVAIVPLIGGSGGGGYSGDANGGGGAGGGAILIASSGNIVLNTGGLIRSSGGAGTYGISGSGGAIKLLATNISGAGQLRATGPAYWGRIRVEAETINLIDSGQPPWTFSLSPGPVFPGAQPTLRATLLDGQPVPADPGAGVTTTDVTITNASKMAVNIVATNIPVGTTINVIVIPDGGSQYTVTSSPLAGTLANSTAVASVTLPPLRRAEIILKANW